MSINIEYQWLCLGIRIYTGKVRGRLSLVLQPMRVMEKLGSGSTSALTQTWLKLTQSLGRPGVVEDEKQGKEEVYIPQGLLEGTERASGTRRSTLLGPTDTQGPHCHLMTCPGFCPQFWALQAWREGRKLKFFYLWEYGRMLGKRSWLRWVDRWVDVWTEVDRSCGYL